LPAGRIGRIWIDLFNFCPIRAITGEISRGIAGLQRRRLNRRGIGIATPATTATTRRGQRGEAIHPQRQPVVIKSNIPQRIAYVGQIGIVVISNKFRRIGQRAHPAKQKHKMLLPVEKIIPEIVEPDRHHTD
jgi:hypothetical protein